MDSAALCSQFDAMFPDASGAAIHVVRAPGRVNLIGEHTDYNDGLVCPMAIDKATVIACRSRADPVVRMHSNIFNQTVEFAIDRPIAKEGPAWTLYPRGVAEALRQKGLLRHGIDALVDSDIPLGGGLSSSAAFEIATSLALLTAHQAKLDGVSLALAGQWAEHHYAGVPCGIMDQFASALARPGHVMLLDCRDQAVRHVPLADHNVRVVIANSNVRHALVDGGYQARREQCDAAVAHLQKAFPAVHSLRDVSPRMLDQSRAGMDAIVFQRARHVVTEIQRTLDFAAALEAKNYVACGELMYGSHESLRDDYAVSCAQLDTLVTIAAGIQGVYGARMTGAGFGGCIVALAKADAVRPLEHALRLGYRQVHGKDATVFATVPSAGAHVVR